MQQNGKISSQITSDRLVITFSSILSIHGSVSITFITSHQSLVGGQYLGLYGTIYFQNYMYIQYIYQVILKINYHLIIQMPQMRMSMKMTMMMLIAPTMIMMKMHRV